MKPYTPSPELRQIVDRLLDEGRLSRTEMARVEELCDDPDALAYFVAMTSQEGMMPEALSRVSSAPAQSRKIIPFQFRTLLKLAAACAIAFFLGRFLHRPVPPASPGPGAAPEHVATFTDADAAAEATGIRIGAPLQKGTLTIPDGSKVGVAMRSGARLEVHGPANLIIEDANKIRLRKGRLSTYAPEYAHGFTVDSDDGKVVDLGTRFVTATGAGRGTEIHVLEGKVEAFAPQLDSAAWGLEMREAGVLKDGKLTSIEFLEQRLNVPLDPVLLDKDGDGIPDVQEVFYHSDPADAASRPKLLLGEESFAGSPERQLTLASAPAAETDPIPWRGYGNIISQGLSYSTKGKSLKSAGGACRTLGENVKGASLSTSPFTLPPQGSTYISYLAQLTTTQGLGTFAGFLLYTGEREELFVGKLAPSFSFGTRFKLSDQNEQWSAIPPDTRTHLFVIRIDRNRLTTDVFVDPELGQPESAFKPHTRYYEVPEFDRVSFRSGGSELFPMVFDELRIGLTWESVLPVAE